MDLKIVECVQCFHQLRLDDAKDLRYLAAFVDNQTATCPICGVEIPFYKAQRAIVLAQRVVYNPVEVK